MVDWSLLPYALRWVKQLSWSTTEGDEETSPFVFPDDPDERISLVFSLSLNEFTKLFSAIEKGATLSYPDEDWPVVWSFLRNFEAPMDICALIAECIASNPTTQDAIRQFVTGDDAINAQSSQDAAFPFVPSSQLATNFGDVADCNPDYLFNVTSVLVDILDEITEDIFEIIEVATNALERGELLVSGFPALGLLPFDEIIGLAEQLAEEVQEEYLSEFTETLRDQIRCDLFCLSRENCDFQIEDAIAYYETKLGESLPQNIDDALQAMGEYILFGSLPGPTAVYAMHLFVLAGLRIAQSVAGVSFTTLALRLTAAADTANNDWLVLCDECAYTWEHIFDFTVDDHDFALWGTFTGTPGTWVSGEGWVSGFAEAGGFAYQMVQINCTFDPTNITYMEVTYNLVNGTNGGLTRLLDTSTATLASSTVIPPNGNGQTFAGSGTAVNAEYVGLRVQAGNLAGNTDPGGTCTVTRLVVRGTGTNPFI